MKYDSHDYFSCHSYFTKNKCNQLLSCHIVFSVQFEPVVSGVGLVVMHKMVHSGCRKESGRKTLDVDTVLVKPRVESSKMYFCLFLSA